jgi:ABC-2 type transport system ATP-binding protein
MERMLRVQDISKRFDSRPVLDRVSFSVRDGEILGLIGPNGAGKTTLFQCLAGLLPADDGGVFHGDRALAAETRKDVLYYVPDGIRPWPDQTLAWTAGFYERLYAPCGMARRVLESLGLAHLAASRMGWLSKGEGKRALLALGLLTPQPLLMLDEPFDGLDLRQMREVMTLLRSVAKSGRTLFLSVHELGHAAQVCERLVLLSGGRVAGEGAAEELRQRAGLPNGSIEDIFLALT